jgi:hypothetical protein
MRSNPFYALSASAMLLGCWLLSQALALQAGQLQGLLILMLVLQVYEGILVGLGSFLVRTGRAPRDGLVVLVIESVFLMDATLLSAECVTTSATVGTIAALVIAALAALKLSWVRQAAPELLTKRAAALLWAHAALILAIPVVAAGLAAARVMGPVALYDFWWVAAPLPLARRVLRDETRAQAQAGDAQPAHSVWTWMPSAFVLLHLWTVGYIHTLDFQPSFLSPLLLGLAVAMLGAELSWQLILPGVAVFCALGREPVLVPTFFGGPVAVSALRVALVGAGLVWMYLGRRDHRPWLAVLGACTLGMGILGSSTKRLVDVLRRSLSAAIPRDIFGWGVLTVIAAFVLLAAGIRRSLLGQADPPKEEPGLLTTGTRLGR